MTLFLWHMTASLLVILALWPAGLGRQRGPDLGWWLERPAWIAGPAVVLLGLTALFGRFERQGRRPGTPVDAAPARS